MRAATWPAQYAHVANPDHPLPAWPVVLLVAGLPVWWLTGLLPFMPIVVSLVLFSYLTTYTSMRFVPGTLPLIAFVVWAAACIVMIDAPLRATGFAIRWSGLAAALLLVIFITNSPALTDRRLLTLLAVPWALLIVGGYVALIAPNLVFTTPVGRILPEGLLSNELVRGLVQPHVAEVQQPFGAPEPFNRPSAPFPYSNSWGAAYAYLLPLMLALRVNLRHRWRLLLDLSIAASLPPALATSNRGMLIILAIAVIYAFGRFIQWGKRRAIALTASAVTIAAVVFVSLGGLEAIAVRQELSKTTEGRSNVYSATYEQTLTSPLMGFGAPQASEEIGIALGTQGAAWMYMFSYGFMGLGLFILFLGGAVARGGRHLPHDQLWIHATLVGALAGMWFYGLDFVHLMILATAAAMLLRRRAQQTGASPTAEGVARGQR